ncbi:hypothetical protein BH23GEM4_BH23GEM4_03490 [soil metagenome]
MRLGVAGAVLVGGYLLVLATAAAWSVAGFALAGVGMLAVAVWLAREGFRDVWLALAVWPAVHLLLLATGSLASPLLLLAGLWTAWVVHFASRLLPAAVVLAGLVPAAAWALGLPVLGWPAVLYTAVVGAGVAAPWLMQRRGADTAPAEDDAQADVDVTRVGDDAAVLRNALEITRLATDAHEAALWRSAEGAKTAHLLAASALPDYPPPEPDVDLTGHPFAWAILEQTHIRLERGRKRLPAEWAREMLLIPVDLPEGVLALAYGGAVPPGAEVAASIAGGHLESVHGLLRAQHRAARTEEQSAALSEVAHAVSGELDLGKLVRTLAVVVQRGSGGAGAAVALWEAEAEAGRIAAVVGLEEREQASLSGPIGAADSCLALAAKHGTTLEYADLAREAEPLPLLVAGERWSAAPRSAVLVPLVVEGKTIAALATWHPDPRHFEQSELEFLEIIAALAPGPLRSAHRFEALDQRASTDALTQLPNRGALQSRLVSLGHGFDRYARPFGVIVLDVDHFKRFNDTWGHDAGDQVLKHVAGLIRRNVREVDLPGRLGGEEFVVLLPESDLAASVETAERILSCIESSPLAWNGRRLTVTASCGAAACPESVRLPAAALKAADAALYRAKEAGRNRVCAAPPAAPPP